MPVQLGAGSIDLIHAQTVNVTPNPPSVARRTPPGFDASTAATIRRPYRVEVIATGPAGRPVDISWEETCGAHRNGNGPSVFGGVGGHGQQRARLPAVLAVQLPWWSTGEDSCYVSALLLTSRYEPGLSVELANA